MTETLPLPMPPEQIARILVRDRDRLIAPIWAVVRDFDLAEDLYQDICADAVEKRDTIDDEPHLINWVRRAGRFRAIDALRRRDSNPLVFDNDVLALIDDEWESPDTDDARRTGQALRHCMDKLTPNAKQLIHLRYAENIKGNALAKRVGKKPNAVFVALSRIHKTLGQCIEAQLALERADDE